MFSFLRTSSTAKSQDHSEQQKDVPHVSPTENHSPMPASSFSFLNSSATSGEGMALYFLHKFTAWLRSAQRSFFRIFIYGTTQRSTAFSREATRTSLFFLIYVGIFPSSSNPFFGIFLYGRIFGKNQFNGC
jgi:hypothetical protein